MLIGISAVKLIDSEEIIVEIYGRAKGKLSLMYQVKVTHALRLLIVLIWQHAYWSKQGKSNRLETKTVKIRHY